MHVLSSLNRAVRCGVFIGVIAAMLVQPSVAANIVRDGNTVTCGQTRFEVLSPTVVRAQYASGGFVESPTAVVTNRNMRDAKITVSAKSGWLTIDTKRLLVSYKMDSGKFAPDNLAISWRDGKKEQKWTPGSNDNGNLGGPFGSFNDIIEQTKPENAMPPFPNGFLSRSGYYVLDDSTTPVWDANSDWITPRKDKNAQDWYFFAYGTDYRDFYRQYTKLCGKIPMIPRYTLGAWVTDLNFEYSGQNLDSNYLYSIIDRFRTEDIPLDVMVLDFGWHYYGWDGGLDWSPIISDPKAFMNRLHRSGIEVTPNDHPSSGLFYADSRIAGSSELMKRLNPGMQNAIQIDKDWMFCTDPNDIGKNEQWFAQDYDDSGWHKMAEVGFWEERGFSGYDGIGWYRKWVDIPSSIGDAPIYIAFGGVDDEYDLYVNGKLVTHCKPVNVAALTQADITSFIRKDAKNLICMSVKDIGGYGGITKLPVVIASGKIGNLSLKFNLAVKSEAEQYMDFHNQLVDDGVDFWWIDGGNASMDGLNDQMWTNKVYYDSQEKHTGKRSFIFSRYGGPGSHRYPAFFTGDCYSNWKTLASEIPYTIKAGNVLSPYVTHDISGFIGTLKDNFELYARWVEFGAFSPMLRLHSAHENTIEGNARLPWNYGKQGTDLCRTFFKIRYSLIPYFYTLTREAYDTGMPLVRGLYLEYPNIDRAYRFDEYLLGSSMLVAPITTPCTNGEATREIYLPPGNWIDYFTGKVFTGNNTINYDCPLERMPVFVKQGSIIPKQPDMAYSSQKPVDPLILDIYAGAPAKFNLYEDDGTSLNYRSNRFALTRITLSENATNSEHRIEIGAAKGKYSGQPQSRSYIINLHLKRKPNQVNVNGERIFAESCNLQSWSWNAHEGVATIKLKSDSISSARNVVVR